jgi:anthranilate phosphoribosyltransferase
MPLLLERRDLQPGQIGEIVELLTEGVFDESEAVSWLTALRMKGESACEIAAAAAALRQKMIALHSGSSAVLDTCGTGGDGSGTFNISTAVALVVAGAGCPVVKHGNRSVSSRSGSADVLSALKVPIESGPAWSQRCLEEFGFAFCFAPHFHPALARVAALRRKLGFRTIFNLLGPLLNPARAAYQLLGVGKPELLDPLAGAVAQLGIEQAYLVCSRDGLDEVSLSAPTLVRRVVGSKVEALEWTVTDFGIEPVHMEELKADGPEASARMIEAILRGEGGAGRRIVLANAAAALFCARKVPTLQEGIQQAQTAVDSGCALHILERLRNSV